MKCAIFCCMGLGDGLITLVLSNNLKRQGHDVVTYHPFLEQLSSFFPGQKLAPFPKDLSCLETYDRLFIIYEKSDHMMEILEKALKEFHEKTTVLNPIATANTDYPYWEQGKFDGNLPFAENLFRYCRDILKLEDPVKDNGIVLPQGVFLRKYSKRVLLHPTSSRLGKNWSKEKYLKLAQKLKNQGYEPVFILTRQEKQSWKEVEAPEFTGLKELVIYVAESGWMIGNDSGIGHLASCVGVPTLTICRNRNSAKFWRPCWSKGEVIVPPRGIPNISGMRLRDKKWQSFVSAGRVYRTFKKMLAISHT